MLSVQPPMTLRSFRPQTVLKTSSGKIRRAACRLAYETDGSTMTRRSVWWQFVRLSAASLVPELRRLTRRLGEVLYASWWWAAFGVSAALVWLPISIVPSIRFGRFVVRFGIRIFLWLTATRLTVEGASRLSNNPKVLVSNHSSYLDGLFLLASLPGNYSFVAKRELELSIWTGPFLTHLSTLFVDRFDARQGVEDAETLVEAAAHGTSLVFFPRRHIPAHAWRAAVSNRRVRVCSARKHSGRARRTKRDAVHLEV